MSKKANDGISEILKSLTGIDKRFQKALKDFNDKDAWDFAQEDTVSHKSHRKGNPNKAPKPSLKNIIKAGKAWLGEGSADNILRLLD